MSSDFMSQRGRGAHTHSDNPAHSGSLPHGPCRIPGSQESCPANLGVSIPGLLQLSCRQGPSERWLTTTPVGTQKPCRSPRMLQSAHTFLCRATASPDPTRGRGIAPASGPTAAPANPAHAGLTAPFSGGLKPRGLSGVHHDMSPCRSFSNNVLHSVIHSTNIG